MARNRRESCQVSPDEVKAAQGPCDVDGLLTNVYRRLAILGAGMGTVGVTSASTRLSAAPSPGE